MKLLLDAHTLLWALYEPEQLPSRARELIQNTENEIFVSLATLWEVLNKAAAHRLPMAGTSVEQIVGHIEQLGVVFLPIAQVEIVASANLPRHHADPFDRILVAQALAHGLSIVTKDADIPRYDAQVLWS